MAHFFVRKAVPSDALNLLRLSESVLTEEVYSLTSPDETYSTEAAEKGWIEESVTNHNHLLLVAECEGEIVGSLDFSNGHRRRIFHTGEISVQVKNSHRNQGIGTALLAEFIEWAESHPMIERVTLRVHADNDRAIHLYEKFGFTKEGHLRGELKYGQGQYVDTFIYSRWVKRGVFCESE